MKYSVLALAAIAAATTVSAQPSGVKWVPLHDTHRPDVERPRDPAPAPAAVILSPAAPISAPATASALASIPSSIAATTTAAEASAARRTQPLEITCLGAGTASKFAFVGGTSTGSFSGFAGSHMVSGTTFSSSSAVVPRDRRFDDQVDIRLFGGDDRIRLPRTMLPPIHGGSDGWFKLKNVVADARSIRASAAVNFINNPKVYIDRVTGTISISGKAGDYSGQCQAIQADAPAKF